ncbi:hypothetical protein J6X73_02855 [Candidatus Saccharibacteria bacterium]|nr:hypothetical protein [Candidatus Saccharibacteria bacterium]
MDNNAVPSATSQEPQQPQQSIQITNGSASDVVSQQSTQPVLQFSQGKSNSKKRKLVITIAIIATLAAIAIAVLAVFIVTRPSKVIGVEDIRNYCNQHNLTLSVDQAAAFCTDSTTTQLIFMPYDDSLNGISSTGVIELENSDEYKKYFARVESSGTDLHYYIICDDSNCLSVAAISEDAARKVMIEIGYPDRNWASAKDQQLVVNASSKAEQRNTARRNDMSRVDTSLIRYQTNNQGKLPPVSDTWTGSETFNCIGSTASACEFVQKYMNSATGSTKNTFMDPDGTLYNLSIQSASTWGDSEKRDVVPAGGMDHTIYIVTSAACSDKQAQKNTARHFAIFYKMENADTYCHDDQ